MTDKPQISWTPALKEQCKTLWLQGSSASEIAKILNKQHHLVLSRNAVIGVVTRAGLGRSAVPAPGRVRCTPQARAEQAGVRCQPSPPRRVVVDLEQRDLPLAKRLKGTAAAAAAPPEPASGQVVQFVGKHCCSWPSGTPGQANFGYCGDPARDGKPYCGHHCAMAYQPSPPSARRADALERSLRRFL